MAEWLKAHAWKACVRETVPWVRIPLSPPHRHHVLRSGQSAKILALACVLKRQRTAAASRCACRWAGERFSSKSYCPTKAYGTAFPGEGHLTSKQFALSLKRKTAPIANWSLVREHSRVSVRACGIVDLPRFPIRKLKVRCALPKPRVPIPSLHPGQFGPNQPETLLIAG